MQQTDKFGGKRGKAVRRAGTKHRWNEPLVEHNLLVTATLDDMRERYARIRVGHVAREQKPRPQGADFEKRRVPGRRGRVTRLPLAHVVPDQIIRAGGLVDIRCIGSSYGNGQIHSLSRTGGPTAIGAGRGSSSGIRKGVPSGNTPAPRRSANLPMLRRSRSSSNSVRPQLCGMRGWHRASMTRSK